MKNILTSLKDKKLENYIEKVLENDDNNDYVVHILDDLEFYQPNEFSNYISIYLLSDKFIIGPVKQGNEFVNGCLKCFIENLESNDSRIIRSANKKDKELYLHEKNISELISLNLKQYLESNSKDIIVVDALNLEQKRYESPRNGGCNYCYIDEYQEVLNAGAIVTLQNLRCRNIKDIIKILDSRKYVKNIDCGIVHSHYRDSASRALPLVGFHSDIYNKRINSFGRTYDYKNSFYVGLLESLERYSNAYPYKYPEYHESEMYLKNNNIKHRPLYHFSYHDFSFKNIMVPKLDKNQKINWVKVKSIKNNEDILIPEQIIYFDSQEYYRNISSEYAEDDRFVYESSNGGALGSCYEEALLYGLFEYIERDSFLVYWYNQLPPTELILNYENINNKNIELYVGFLDSIGYKLHCYDTTLESKVPSIWVLIEYTGEDDRKIAFYTAAGSHLNPEKALESALIECVTAVDTFQKSFEDESKQLRRKELLEDFTNVDQLQDHLLLYSNKEMRKHLEFALDIKTITNFTEQFSEFYNETDLLEKKTIKEVLDVILNRILDHHDDIYVAYTGNPNISSLELASVKVIIPSMLTMTFGHQNRRVNVERVKKAPVLNKLRKTEIEETKINTVPHPFP